MRKGCIPTLSIICGRIGGLQQNSSRLCQFLTFQHIRSNDSNFAFLVKAVIELLTIKKTFPFEIAHQCPKFWKLRKPMLDCEVSVRISCINANNIISDTHHTHPLSRPDAHTAIIQGVRFGGKPPVKKEMPHRHSPAGET